MKRIINILLIGFITSVNAANWLFTPKDVTSLHKEPPTATIKYGKSSQNFGNLRLPNKPGPYPVAIIIHGGCWVTKFANISNTEAIADALRDSGFATWNIEYRAANEKGGGFPGTFLDIANATDYLRKLAPKYQLDLQHVVAIGHSSGGHLALWLAGRDKLSSSSSLYLKNPLTLNGVITLGGVPDLEIARVPAEKVCGSDVIGQLLGNTITKQRYAETSPIDMLPLSAPQIFISGELDTIVPTAIDQPYMQKASQIKDAVKLINVPYAGHHEYIVPNSVVWPILIQEIKALLESKHIVSSIDAPRLVRGVQ